MRYVLISICLIAMVFSYGVFAEDKPMSQSNTNEENNPFAEKIEIGPVSQATLGEPLDIPVRIKSGLEAKEIFFSQKDNDTDIEIKNGDGPVQLQHSTKGDYIEIIPQGLGEMEFKVTAAFGKKDLGFSSITVNVNPPATPPLSFKLNHLPVLGMVIDGVTEPVARLAPVVTYSNIKDDVYVPIQFIKFKILPTKGPIPITISETGLIRAIQSGEAIIEGQFGSVIDRIPVFVQSEK